MVRSRLTVTLVGLLGLVIVYLAQAVTAADQTIGQYVLLQETRISRTVFEYTYRATLTNTGAPLSSASATASSSSTLVTIIDGTLSFAAVGTGQTRQSVDTFTIRVNRSGVFTLDQLHWTVSAVLANRPPAAAIAPIDEAFVGQAVGLDGAGSSDPDGDSLTYAWALVGKPAQSNAAIQGASSPQASFTPDRPGTYQIQLTVSDGKVSATSTATLNTSNRSPIAEAGAGQTVATGATVMLDGSGSTDPDGDELTYSWSFVSVPSGSSASLTNSATAKPSFIVDRPGNYVVRLLVKDPGDAQSVDEVTVSTENTLPVANAGPDQSVSKGAVVTLDGSASSDADGDPLTFSWSIEIKPDGSTAVLSSASSVQPTFVADRPGTFTIRLTVTEPSGGSSSDLVNVTTSNTPPVANAGVDQTVAVGATVTLDGTGSTDVDGDPLTFQWALTTRPANSNATLSLATAAKPTFTIDLPGEYIAQLIVNDGLASSAADTVVISTENARPVANAGGDQSITVGAVVSLDGSASSDPDGDPLSFAWAFTSKPANSQAVLSSATSPTPSFVPDKSGTYVVQLVVSDPTLSSIPDTVTLTTSNNAPTANAGPDQSVTLGANVQLDGTGSSDPDADALTFQWAITTRPQGSIAVLSNTAAAQPTFTPDVAGDYVVQLVVSDGTLSSAPDTMAISVAPANQSPLAAGDSYAGAQDTPLVVAGPGVLGNDSDPDGDTITAVLLNGPTHGQLTLASSGGFTYTPNSGFSGADSFTYRAFDGTAHSSATTVNLQIHPKPAPPVVNAPIAAGATLVAGSATASATVQVFVNGVARGTPATALGNGTWSAGPLSPALASGDSVTARQTVAGVQSDPSTAVIVSGGGQTSAVVGPSGGTLQLPDGLRLVIPPGALTAPTTISISEAPVPSGAVAPPTGVAAGKMYSFQPSGMTFNAPVEMRLPYDPSLLPPGYEEESVFIHRLGPDGRFYMVGGETDDPEPESAKQDVIVDANSVTVSVRGFSQYLPYAVLPASAFSPVAESLTDVGIVIKRPAAMRTTRPNVHNCAAANLTQGPMATRTAQSIRAIVIHSTNSGSTTKTINGELGWATDPCNKFFAQYYLDRNGDIYQVVADTVSANHTASTTLGVSSANSIGIELLNNVGEPYDGRMIAALIRLIDYLMVRYPSITRPERAGSNMVVRNVADINAGGDSIIAHIEHQPGNKVDPIGTFMSSQTKRFFSAFGQNFPLSTAAVTGGAAGPSLMQIVVDAVAVLGRDQPDTGVVNTSGGDAFGVRTGGNGGDVTWRENATSVGQRLGTAVQKLHTENSLLVVPQGTTRNDITGLQQFSDAIIAGTIEISSALDLRIKGTVYLAPTGRIIVRNGFEGQNLAITTRGAPLVQGLIETAALEATSDQTGAAGGHVQVFAAAAGPHLIPTIITRGGDGDSADVVAGVGWGGNGGAVTIEIGDSHVFIGGGAGETGTPAMRTVADPNFLPPDHVGDFLPLPPPFNLGSIGLNRPATGQRVPLRKAASQLGFLRGILTSGGMGGTGIGGTTAQQAGAPGGAGGSFTLNTGSTGRITFRDVDLITGADVEMVISEIFVPDATSAIQLPYFAATGSLGGRGTIAGTSGGAGGAGGIAGAITVNGTLSPVPSSIDLVGGVQGDGAIIGFNSNGRPFQSDDPFTDFIIGTTVQASAGGKNLYRLRLDLSGNALGGSGGIPSGRASGFPGSFGPRGAGSPITGLPK